MEGAAVLVFGLAALVLVVFLGDFLWLYFRGARFRFSAEGRGEGKAYRGLTLLRVAWFLTFYKWLPSSRIRLAGIQANADKLYDGQMIAAGARWWNELYGKRRGLLRIGGHPLDQTTVASTQSTVCPANAALLKAYARSSGPPHLGDLAEAALALAYALARIFAAGTDTDWHTRPQPIRADDIALNNRRYDFVEASDLYGVPSEGFWREMELLSLWNAQVIREIRRAYTNQVHRWEKAEGRELGSGVGFSPLAEGHLVDKFADLLFENGGRFEETELAVQAWFDNAAETTAS